MNNKKKWASILTIATSLVLCIISTFGITLAFFGGNASANLSTITLKTGIEIGAAIESSVGSAKVVPGQPVKITATGTVSATTQGTNPDANNAVDGVVRAKFNVGNELGTVTIAGNSTDFWKEGGDGYYYLVTAENGTTLRTVSKGTSVQIFGDLVVSKNFTNADSGKSVEASVIFEVIQADIYKADGTKIDLTIANATASTSNALKDAFSAVKVDDYVAPMGLSYIDESNIIYDSKLSQQVKPYAVVQEDSIHYIYFAIDTTNMTQKYGNQILFYWSSGGSAEDFLDANADGSYSANVIQDGDFKIKEFSQYGNVSNEYWYQTNPCEAGPTLIVVKITNTTTATIVNNVDYLLLEVGAGAGGND